MKVGQYLKGGQIVIADAPAPELPMGGLLVRTEACGLCSGELMAWYMEGKAPHVFGHEVAGIVTESEDDRFPVGCRVFPHHHAACGTCDECRRGNHVFCAQWNRTKLLPGGMAETFAVPAENLADTLKVDHLRAIDAALIEPLGCVVKSVNRARIAGGERIAVIGLGVMGLMHLLLLPRDAVGYELRPDRRTWAASLGLRAEDPDGAAAPADVVFVCPGSEAALRLAIRIAAPGARIVLFAPLPPGETTSLNLCELYFLDFEFISSYSCGPLETRQAERHLTDGVVTAEQVVSHFIALDELPWAYGAMRSAEILKPMVVFE
jgi:L-iditol 2-dehydrogenase